VVQVSANCVCPPYCPAAAAAAAAGYGTGGAQGYSTAAAAPRPCTGADNGSVLLVYLNLVLSIRVYLLLLPLLCRIAAVALLLALRAKEVLRAAGRTSELREALFACVAVIIVGIHVSRAFSPTLAALLRCLGSHANHLSGST